VTAENAGASALIANRAAIGAWEQFDELDQETESSRFVPMPTANM